MKFCSNTFLEAMRRPDTSIGFEGAVVGGMPISCGVDLRVSALKCLDVFIQNRDDLIAIWDGERAAWAKIVLNIDDKKRVMLINSKRHLDTFIYILVLYSRNIYLLTHTAQN